MNALLEADALADLREDLPGVLFADIPWEQPDDCSECPNLDPLGPFPSTLVVVYERYGRPCAEPVCGRICTVQKLRDLFAAGYRPEDIQVFVIQKHMIDNVEANEAA